MEREVIYGQVVAKANHYTVAMNRGNGERHIILDEAYKAYQRSFISQCRIYANRLIDCPFLLHVHVWHSSPRFDLDNSLKSLLDLLQDVHAIKDDNLCVGIQAIKHIDRQHPRVEFCIFETQPKLF